MDLVDRSPRHLFFTGKGGVGKTSVACATALTLASRGRRVLLVSTDPASNLDEVLDTPLGAEPRPVRGAEGLFALNIDPEESARAYRERMVGPYRGVLPAAAIQSIEEQLSGACTVEIAAFDELSKLLGDASATSTFDHVIFDTAPTGHTLRLLELPAAWSGFLETNVGGTSCLGPLAGLKAQQALYAASRRSLVDAERTSLVLVSQAEPSSLLEAERTRGELAALGITRQELVLNGLFRATDRADPVACAIEDRDRVALADMPPGLAALPRTELPLLPFGLVGLEEDLRSPCTEEIAVFRAFARVVDEGERGFVIIDTAPTGHTLLLLDAAEAYHREVLRKLSDAPDEVRRLLPRLRDPAFTRILLVALPEATPVHEAAQLERDLARAEIRPFAWVVNRSLTPLSVTDPVLVRRRAHEARYLAEVAARSPRVAIVPWS